VPQTDHIHLGACELQCAHRERQLDLFETVGCQHGNPAAGQTSHVGHEFLLSIGAGPPEPAG
jgi:hypothetical protein